MAPRQCARYTFYWSHELRKRDDAVLLSAGRLVNRRPQKSLPPIAPELSGNTPGIAYRHAMPPSDLVDGGIAIRSVWDVDVAFEDRGQRRLARHHRAAKFINTARLAQETSRFLEVPLARSDPRQQD